MKNLTLLFLKKDNEVLLALKKRGFGIGRWNGVGGKVEENETVEDAMIRECQEEINVKPLVYTKSAKIYFNEWHEGKNRDFEVTVYISTEWEGDPEETDEMSPKWFKISDIPYDLMWPDDKFWLGTVLEGKKIKAYFALDETDTIIRHNLEIVDKI